MTSHRILVIWLLIYISQLALSLGLIFYIQAIRIRIAIILICLIFSFIFYPVYLLDKRNSTRVKKSEKIKKTIEVTSDLNESEKNKEQFEIPEQESKTQDDSEKKIEITCDYCGKKIDEDVKLCPYCGTEL